MSRVEVLLTFDSGLEFEADLEQKTPDKEAVAMSESSEDDQEIPVAPSASEITSWTRKKRKFGQMSTTPSSDTLRSLSSGPSGDHARRGAGRGNQKNKLAASVTFGGQENRRSSRLSIKASDTVIQKEEVAPKRKRGRPPLKTTAKSRLQKQPITEMQPVRRRFSLCLLLI